MLSYGWLTNSRPRASVGRFGVVKSHRLNSNLQSEPQQKAEKFKQHVREVHELTSICLSRFIYRCELERDCEYSRSRSHSGSDRDVGFYPAVLGSLLRTCSFRAVYPGRLQAQVRSPPPSTKSRLIDSEPKTK